jgi:acyl-CoA synthetase (NDP forming)
MQGLIDQLTSMIHPRSVALIGVPRGAKMGKVFLTGLLDQDFKGHIYPVNPKVNDIDGFKTYPTLSAIPEPVDLAIVLVPHSQTLPVVRECAAKGVKGAVLFTAGYGETGTEEGQALEKELARIAQTANMRLIGPNSMGIYAPKSGLAFFYGLPKSPGPVGIISQSGSLAVILARMAPQRGVYFSKVLSVGNQCDLTSADFFYYLGQDDETQVIGAYLEGIKEGRRFLEALREASKRKPVILWKLGLTDQGRQAAASHTGALTGAEDIWRGVVNQSGGVFVEGLEEWVDTLMAFTLLPSHLMGNRTAIISGPGGLAVAAAEACGREGMVLAKLNPESQAALAKFLPPTGTSFRNPIDVGLSASSEPKMFARAATVALENPEVDVVVVIGTGGSPEGSRKYTDLLIDAHRSHDKPFLIVKLPGFDPKLCQTFCEAGIPVFETAERAMSTYARVRRYWRWRDERKV